MTLAFEIRTIAPHELSGLLTLYHYLHPNDAPLSETSQVVAVWEQICAYPHLYCFVADIHSQLVATCTLTIIPNLTRMARPYGLIENVVTHPDFRKRGLGSQILAHALNFAWGRNCYKVMLLTGSKREETLRFYEHAGFKRDIKTGFVAYPEDPHQN